MSKKFWKGVFALLVMTVCMCMYSCHKQLVSVPTTTDSVTITTQIEEVINPSFTSVKDVKIFQKNLVEEYSVDEEFRNLPPDILTNVANVCLKKYGEITKRLVVDEYRANNSIYNNLPETTETRTTVDSTTAKNGSTHKPVTRIYYRTDTVEGKPHRVLVKEEITYE